MDDAQQLGHGEVDILDLIVTTTAPSMLTIIGC